MSKPILAILVALVCLRCSAATGDATSYPDPPPVRTAQQASGSAQGADAAAPEAPLPRCADDPAAKRCIGTEEVAAAPPADVPHPGPIGPARFWENRDAGSCVSAIPVYGVGECDCDKPGPVCGDGCGPRGAVQVFCVCGGLREEKRAATWEIPGWTDHCAPPDAGAGDAGADAGR
jgi:hypothetical protein